MTASILMSTDELAPRDRAPAWRDWIWRQFGGLESDLYGDTDFDGHLASSQAGDVILTRLEAKRHRVLRSAGMARASDSAYLKIVAPWRGLACVHQDGREAQARAGSWVIYDTTGSYDIANPQPVEHLIVMLPKAQMIERGLHLEPPMARRLGESGIARVALETMRNTYQELPHMSEGAAQGAGELIKQLVRLSLLELSGKETAGTQRLALRDRIRAHVASHLRDPELSVDSIARALNCSRRHLYNAFSGDGETLAAYIQRQRLEACVRDLQQTGLHGRPITDIALSWGFGNLSHFSRLFREHTGSSPSEFRLTSMSRPPPH